MQANMTPLHRDAQNARKKARADIVKTLREYFGISVPPGVKKWDPNDREKILLSQFYEIVDQAITDSQTQRKGKTVRDGVRG